MYLLLLVVAVDSCASCRLLWSIAHL